MASQPGSPLSSPTKNTKKQKVSGTLVHECSPPPPSATSAFANVKKTLGTPLARGGSVRMLRTSVHSIIWANLGHRIPRLDPQGPSPNPRYPRASANRRPLPFSNPMRRESRPRRALRLLPPPPRPLPAFSGMEGRMAPVLALS
jgi:hypothetical protein